MVKNLPTNADTQETRVQSLCQEDPLEEEMAPLTEEPDEYSPWTHRELDTTE